MAGKSLSDATLRAIDAWNRLRYFHQLLEFDCSEDPDTSVLLLECYKILAEPHSQDLSIALNQIYQLITGEMAGD